MIAESQSARMAKVNGTSPIELPASLVQGLESLGYIRMSDPKVRPARFVHKDHHNRRIHVVTSNMPGESAVMASMSWNRKVRRLEPDAVLAEATVMQ